MEVWQNIAMVYKYAFILGPFQEAHPHTFSQASLTSRSYLFLLSPTQQPI